MITVRKAVYGYDQRAEVFGSEGMVSMKNDSESSAVISNADGVTGEKPLFFFLERYIDIYMEKKLRRLSMQLKMIKKLLLT